MPTTRDRAVIFYSNRGNRAYLFESLAGSGSPRGGPASPRRPQRFAGARRLRSLRHLRAAARSSGRLQRLRLRIRPATRDISHVAMSSLLLSSMFDPLNSLAALLDDRSFSPLADHHRIRHRRLRTRGCGKSRHICGTSPVSFQCDPFESLTNQLTVSTSALLLPPLVQPRSPVFPLGVSTMTFTDPGPEITSLVSFIFSCWALTTVALKGVELMRTSEADTNWLPLIVSSVPACTSEKVTVLGESEPISGAGRALPHSGLRALLHPARNNREDKLARDRPARVRPSLRDCIRRTPLRWVPAWLSERTTPGVGIGNWQ